MSSSKNGSKVRLEDIAKRLGISKMTVSLALRNDFAVASATKEKVKALAEEMGYKRNPLISLHMAQLRRSGSTRFHPKLAFINPHVRKEDIQISPAQSAFLKGAAKQAAELGYELEEVWLGDEALKSCSLKTYFKRRGIHGFISLGEPEGRGIPWDCFPAVVVGYTKTNVGLHRVCNNQRHSAQLVLLEMAKLGCKRVSLAMRVAQDFALDENYSSAFLSEQSWLPEADRLPLFRPVEWTKKGFFNWLSEARPDAVAGLNYELILPQLAEYNKLHGMSIQPVALAHNRHWKGCPGVDQMSLRVGSTALEMVVQQINMGLSGVPKEPWLILLEGKWVPPPESV